MSIKLRIALAALAIGSASPVIAAPEDFAATIADDSRLEANRNLDESRQPAIVLDFADIEKGATVADFLAGSGYYTEMLSQIVGSKGRVYVFNPANFHTAEVWDAILAERKNVSTLVVPPKHLQFAPSSVDVIFTHLNFHDLYWESERFNFPRMHVPSILSNWHAGLKSGGEVIVVDHLGPAGDTRDVVERLHRIDPSTVVAAMEQAGFALVGQSDALKRDADDIEKSVFDEGIRGNTSRFMMKFKKM